MNRAEYAVIVPHFNDVERLSKCLAALSNTNLDGIGIYVVDNGSTQSLNDVRERFPHVKFLTEPKPGAANARNYGVANTNEPYLFFIDADCIPDAAWIATAKHCVHLNAITGGKITVFDETAPPRSGPQAFETVFAFDNARYIRQQHFSVTANLVTRREVFEKVGPMRHGFSEDLDWCHRAVASDYEINYNPALVVSHPSRSDWPALKKKWLRLTKEGFKVNGDSPVDRVRWALKAIAMPASAAAHLPKILNSTKLAQGEALPATITLFRLRIQRMVWMLKQAFGRPI